MRKKQTWLYPRSAIVLLAALVIATGPIITAVEGAATVALVYVANSGADTVSVIDTSTNTVVDTIIVSNGPTDVEITPDGTKAYVPSPDSDTVDVIDLSTNTVMDTITLVGNGVADATVAPNGARVYVTFALSCTFNVIDTATNTVVHSALMGGCSGRVAVTPDGTKAYVPSPGFDGVRVLETATYTEAGFVAAGGGDPSRASITPDGAQVYVANWGGFNNVTVIDTATDALVTNIPVSDSAKDVTISPDGETAYVTVATVISPNVTVINTATNAVVTTIPVGAFPQGVEVTPDGAKAYVTHNIPGTISVIDTATNNVTGTLPVGASPMGIDIKPAPAPTPTPTPAVPNLSPWGLLVTAGALVALVLFIGVQRRQWHGWAG